MGAEGTPDGDGLRTAGASGGGGGYRLAAMSAPAPAPEGLLATTLRPGGRRTVWNPVAPEWVLLDMDGTLVGLDGVSDAVAEAVRAVADAGIRIGYATGRNVAGPVEVHRRLGVEGPHVVLNGAQLRRDGAALETWGLRDADVHALLELCRRQDLYAELYLDDGVLVTAMDTRFQPHWEEIIGWPLGTVAERPPAPGEVIKATIVATDDVMRDQVVEAVADMGLSAGPATSPVTPGVTYVNITRPDVDKGAAIRAGAERLGVDLSAVVVIGDGHNDLPMLAVAGTAIAMGDAPEDVRAAAHLVTGGVEEDGAATALLDLLRRS